jgi:hypothetical protein
MQCKVYKYSLNLVKSIYYLHDTMYKKNLIDLYG